MLDIQSETYLKIKSIKENRINKPRKKQENKLKFILRTWTKLEQNEISILEYLKIESNGTTIVCHKIVIRNSIEFFYTYLDIL